jgi:DNA polymerase III subunit delta
MTTKPKTPAAQSQVYIFYGEDDFSLTKKIERWKQEFSKKFGPSSVTVINGDGSTEQDIVAAINQASAPSLFASKKLILCKDALPKKAGQETLMETILKLIAANDPNNFIVFHTSGRLDQRLGATKQLLKSGANINEFTVPHGSTLAAWLKAYAKQMEAAIDDKAADTLAVYLGRDLYEEKKFGGRVTERKEGFDLWQAYQEMLKLTSRTSRISEADVKALVVPRVSENVFNLSDTIFKKDKTRALKMMEGLFEEQSADEKSTAIKIVALLAEQVRALLLVLVLKDKNMNNDQIAEALGWSSGRVFMVLKQSGSVTLKSLTQMLKNLLEIDLSLKSRDVSPKLLLNSFVIKHA